MQLREGRGISRLTLDFAKKSLWPDDFLCGKTRLREGTGTSRLTLDFEKKEKERSVIPVGRYQGLQV